MGSFSAFSFVGLSIWPSPFAAGLAAPICVPGPIVVTCATTSAGRRHAHDCGNSGTGDVLIDEPLRRVEVAGRIEAYDQGPCPALLRRGKCIMQVFGREWIDTRLIRGEHYKPLGSCMKWRRNQGGEERRSRDNQEQQTGLNSPKWHRAFSPTRLRIRETEHRSCACESSDTRSRGGVGGCPIMNDQWRMVKRQGKQLPSI
jgi:hypothetical protein